MGELTNSGRTAALELPEPLVEAIKAEAKRTHRAVSRLVADALASYLEDQEDLRAVLAVKKKGAAPVPLAEVKKRLGLEG